MLDQEPQRYECPYFIAGNDLILARQRDSAYYNLAESAWRRPIVFSFYCQSKDFEDNNDGQTCASQQEMHRAAATRTNGNIQKRGRYFDIRLKNYNTPQAASA